MTVSRRQFIAGLATSSLSPLTAANEYKPIQRPAIRASSRNTVCDNGQVPVSNADFHLSHAEDFARSANCRLTPKEVEGPYFLCDRTNTQRVIVGDRRGIPLTLCLRVTDRACNPISKAVVDIWHCDARGNYSGFGTTRNQAMNDKQSPLFLRGTLATNPAGIVEFETIYPGYYSGRAIHTHYKVHIGNTSFLTSQSLYPESFNEYVMSQAPYKQPRQSRRVLNNDDWLVSPDRTFRVVERSGKFLATLNLIIPA